MVLDDDLYLKVVKKWLGYDLVNLYLIAIPLDSYKVLKDCVYEILTQ